MSFQDRVAIVTGGTSGIGAETVRRLSREGATVLATGRDSERGSSLAEECERVSFLTADLTEDGAPARVVAAALGEHGRLDVLVNNAALDHTGELTSVSMAEAREVFEVNFFASLAMLQLAAAAMRADDGGSIVNVTSRLASIGVEKMGVYSASKGALLALTRSAALELAPHGVRVNAVAPGMTRTPLYEAWVAEQDDPEGTRRAVAEAVPQGRIAEAVDVAAAIVFLASADASHITGASLPVDGGYTAA
jgi:NAD(P)-dependent dehydrogenase (short-subunit alcohol dehydrogenase family)